jgi:isopentenyldiphosphate isomerase
MDRFGSKRDIAELLENFSEKLPHFPDGRIDYRTSSEAPVITCFVQYEGRILLLRRSDKVGTYRGMWNSVAGYIDEIVPLQQKILEELREELGIREEDIAEIRIAAPYRSVDEAIDKTWIIFPCLTRLKILPQISLDWEHTQYRWISPEELEGYLIVPDLDKSLEKALS